jgi:ribonucleoside-diphosphate reductase alpha chain
MIVEPLFTGGSDPYLGITWAERTVSIFNTDGSKASKEYKVTVPDDWSETATSIFADKYLRKAGVPDKVEQVPEEGVPAFLFRQRPQADAKFGAETDARNVFHRLAGTWAYEGWKQGWFTPDDARAFYSEILYMLARQMMAPNSPQWFNTGLWWAYEINVPATGQYQYDPAAGKAVETKDAYSTPQTSACFINSLKDDLIGEYGIMDLWTREAKIFKFGSGSGANYSPLRGANEPLSGGGKSSGLMSFLKTGDSSAGAIKSGGVTRRAARMVVLDADHPDIEEFIDWKMFEEQKVAELAIGSRLLNQHVNAVADACTDVGAGDRPFDKEKNPKLKRAVAKARLAGILESFIDRAIHVAKLGYTDIRIPVHTTQWGQSGYETVNGQNANNSVRLSNRFMGKIFYPNNCGDDWDLFWRTELAKARAENRPPVPCKTISANGLWERLNYASWSCADPGVQFDDTINEWHTCPNDGKINASNPCSEYLFLDDTSCNLASLNLVKFIGPGAVKFEPHEFAHAARLTTVVLEITVGMSAYPSPVIAERSYKYRTVGLGYANLGAYLMRNGIPYDSEAGRHTAAAITALMHCTAYTTSSEMAAYKAPFERYAANKDAMGRVIHNHWAAAAGDHSFAGLTVNPQHIDPRHVYPPLYEAVQAQADKMRKGGMQHGFRNAQVTVIAPTGTIGIVMDCDTTGVEPDFALVKFKKLAGGGYLKIINQSVPPALKNLGYTADQINDIVTYASGHKTIKGVPHYDLLTTDPATHQPYSADKMIEFEDQAKRALSIKGIFPEENVKLLTPEQRAEAEQYVCGRLTTEGAPHLKPEHYPVFDCANRCGQHGRRSIAAEAHVRMLGAVQPFVSGAISKTINLDHDATVDDFAKATLLAWEVMGKCVAMYRKNSKLSEVLNTTVESMDGVSEAMQDTQLDAYLDWVENNDPTGVAAVLAAKAVRQKLPDRRRGYTQKARVGNNKVYLRTGEYKDGTLGEIFIDMHKEGAAFRAMMNNFAIAVSLGLQHGVPLEEFVDAFTFTKFEPNGPVVGNDSIKMCTSILDYIFRELAVSYLGMTDLAHVQPAPADTEPAPVKAAGKPAVKAARGSIDPTLSKRELAIMMGYEGDPCWKCQQLTLVQNGVCKKCMTCGETTGCS